VCAPLSVSAVFQALVQLCLGRHLIPKPSHGSRSFSGGPRRATFLRLACIIIDSHVWSLNCPASSSASFSLPPSCCLTSPVSSPTTNSSWRNCPPPRLWTSSSRHASNLRMVQLTPPRALQRHRVLLHQLWCHPRPIVQPSSLFLLLLMRVTVDSLTGEPLTFPTPQNCLPTPSSRSIHCPTPPHPWHAGKSVGRRRLGHQGRPSLFQLWALEAGLVWVGLASFGP
jgi:hypothetical protein